jgi:glucan biosynthesis protein C
MTKLERRYDLDWLRVLATLGVFTMHCFRFFDPMDWEVKNNVTSENLLIILFFFAQWLMPLFFTVSGASIYFALSFRTPRQFVKTRVLRILIPYLGIGIFVLVPPQDYIKVVPGGKIPELAGMSFTQYYPEYVTHMSLFYDEFPFVALPMMHLWYLFYLFVFSLVLLLLFAYLKSARGAPLLSRFANYLATPWNILLLALPIALLTSLLDPATPVGNINWFGGWSLLVYPIFLVYGYLLFADDRFEEVMESKGKTALSLSVLTFPLILVAFKMMIDGEGFFFGTPEYAGLMLLRALNTVFSLVAFIGLGKQYLSFTNKTLKYTSEGSLPFYMLH